MGGGDALPEAELADACSRLVTAVFPNICPQFLEQLASSIGLDASAIINHIVDQEAEGKPYPRSQAPNALKRKRGTLDDEAQEVARVKRIYDVSGRRPRVLTHRLAHQIRDLLYMDFPQVPLHSIQAALHGAQNFLLPAYVALYESTNERGERDPWGSSVRAPCARGRYAPETLGKTIENCLDSDERDTLLELQAARRTVASRERERRAEMEKDRAEKANFEEALADGFIKECECCFVEFALNRLTQCSADTAHWFCFQCCRRQAETLVGLSKYELTCMSMDGCPASFSHVERQRFLDKKLASALDRAEQEAVLRLANLENLVSCPFCPFAAECSPTEVDREFRCQNPECQVVSCRLCDKETHIPKTCEEAAKEHGYSARRTIEEAMSAALIRRCNKCNTPFIKEDGCNKMMCTRPACRNVQCYVCSKSCDYSHFNDPNRGGKEGNCPLFDSVETRHAKEIKDAEEETRKRVVDANPDVDPEHLKFHMSDQISQDERRREGAQRRAPELVHILQRQGPRVPEPRVPQVPAAARMPQVPVAARVHNVPRMADNAPGNAGHGDALVPRLLPNMVLGLAQDARQQQQRRQRHLPRDNVYHVAAQPAVQAHRAAVAGSGRGEALQRVNASPVPPFGVGFMGANVGVNQPRYDDALATARDPTANRPVRGVYPRPREHQGVAGPTRNALARGLRHGPGPSDKRQASNAATGGRVRADFAAPVLRPVDLAVQVPPAANGDASGRNMAVPEMSMPPDLGNDLNQAIDQAIDRVWFPLQGSPQLRASVLPYDWMMNQELGDVPAEDYGPDALFFGDGGGRAENPRL